MRDWGFEGMSRDVEVGNLWGLRGQQDVSQDVSQHAQGL